MNPSEFIQTNNKRLTRHPVDWNQFLVHMYNTAVYIHAVTDRHQRLQTHWMPKSDVGCIQAQNSRLRMYRGVHVTFFGHIIILLIDGYVLYAHG
jgi:hypothetical protein